MRPRFAFVAALALCVMAVVPAGASAARNCQGATTAPPGNNSEVDQYYETVPNGCTDGPVNPPSPGNGSDGSGANGSSAGAVPADTAAQLQARGKDGRAALRLARSGAAGTTTANDFSGGGKGADAGGGGVGNFLSAIFGSIGGSGIALGWLLPLLLIAVAIGGAYYLLARRRSQPS